MIKRFFWVLIALCITTKSQEATAQSSGNMLQLNGTSNFVNIPASPVSTLSDFTIET